MTPATKSIFGRELDRLLPQVSSRLGLCVFAILLANATWALAEPAHDHGPRQYPAEMNQRFASPETDVQEFVKRFENDQRDVYVKRHEIVRAMGLRPGDRVADIGAGTGLFTLLFAKEVGQQGQVYAVDISEAFLKHIANQAKNRGQQRIVRTILNSQDSAGLPPSSVDVAFLCNTYHHFDHPEKMLASLYRALRRGGRLVVIDFDLRPDSSEFVKKRARAPKETYFREIVAAGFRPVSRKDLPAIKDNFFAEFERVESR